MRTPRLPSLTLVLLAACGGSPAGPVDPPVPPPPGTARLVILGPSTLLVHESALYTAQLVRTGPVSVPDTTPQWSSSNPAVVRVDSGVAVGVGRGSAELSVTMGGLEATIPVQVRARLRLVAEGAVDAPATWTLGQGDTLHLEAVLVDVDGAPIGERPAVTWWSSDPSVASVNAAGVVAGVAPGRVQVWASGAEGTAGLTVDVEPGMWPTVRIAHAAAGLGPVRFTFSAGDPVTLAFGEAVHRVVPPGNFVASAPDLPAGGGYAGFRTVSVRLGALSQLSVFAVGNNVQAFLAEAWSDGSNGAPGMGRIRLVQGWNDVPVVYLRPTGAGPEGVPELCYFDPGQVSPYYLLPAGPFDILLQTKYGGAGLARLSAAAPDGQSVTYVLTGDRLGSLGFLAFPDP